MGRGGVGRAGTDAPRRLLDGHGTSCWGQQVGGRGHRHYGRVQCIETDAKDTLHRRGSPPPPTVRTRVATAGGETPLCPKRTLSRQRAARRRGDSDWRLRAGLGRGGRGTDRAAPPPLPREVTIYDVAARPDMTLHRWTGPPLRPPLARAASPRHATTHRHSRIQAFSFSSSSSQETLALGRYYGAVLEDFSLGQRCPEASGPLRSSTALSGHDPAFREMFPPEQEVGTSVPPRALLPKRNVVPRAREIRPGTGLRVIIIVL